MVFGKKTNDDDQSGQWKKKYYDSLDDLEYKEEQWHQAEKLLRNALVRISLAADTSSKKLTDLLNTLRDDIRNGKDSLNLKNQFDKIIAVIRDLDSSANTSANEEAVKANLYTAKKLVDECINRTLWSDKAAQFKRGLARQFNNIQDDDLQKFIHSYTKLVNQEFVWFREEIDDKTESSTSKVEPEQRSEPVQKQAADQNQEHQQTEQSAIPPSSASQAEFERVPQPDNTASLVPPASEKGTPLEYPALLLTLIKKIPHSILDESKTRKLQLLAAGSKSRQAAVDCIEQIVAAFNTTHSVASHDQPQASEGAIKLLIEFLELITLPDELSVKAEEIRQELINQPDKLKQCLNDTVELVMAVQINFKNERKELELFLAEICKRLQEIDIEVKKISGINDNRKDNADQMSNSLHEATDEIEKFLDNDIDLETLKDNVKSHVIMIRHHMDTFLHEEKQQHSYSDQAVQQLAKDLIAVKREAEELREQLEQKRLQATHDTLTRIPNRFAYEEWIEQEYDRFIKYDTPFVMMLWDVDYFKRVNDNYGHAAGDKVLRVVAQMLSENIREADFVARFGGEEFVVVLPSVTIDKAMKIAEGIRLAIEACAFHFREDPVKVTASAGIAEVRREETIEMLFDRADKALYKAKDSGRNTCIPA